MNTNYISVMQSRLHSIFVVNNTTVTWSVVLTLLIVFLACGPLLRVVDPVAAAVDIGAFSLVLLAVVALWLFAVLSRWLLGLLWPVFKPFELHHVEPIFKSLSPWQKLLIYLSCYFLLLYAFILSLLAIV